MPHLKPSKGFPLQIKLRSMDLFVAEGPTWSSSVHLSNPTACHGRLLPTAKPDWVLLCCGHTVNTPAGTCLKPQHCLFSRPEPHLSRIFPWPAPRCHSDLSLWHHLIRAFPGPPGTPYLTNSTSPYLNLSLALTILWHPSCLHVSFLIRVQVPIRGMYNLFTVSRTPPTPPTATLNYHLSGHSFTEQIFTEHLLCARHNDMVAWYCPNQCPFFTT